jgi:hypothetical protein
MKLDVSAAPEIARLAHRRGAAAPPTIGRLAACLRLLEADPRSWWDLVRFDPDRPVRIPVAEPRTGTGCEAWLLVLPPGYRGGDQPEHDWEVACLVAGVITEQPGRPLLPGRIRVRGGRQPRELVNAGGGYAVSLHARRAFPPGPPLPGAAAAA